MEDVKKLNMDNDIARKGINYHRLYVATYNRLAKELNFIWEELHKK